MTKLALINDKTFREGVNEVGDIVGTFLDNHIFSEHEKIIFDIVDIPETKTVIDIQVPETKQLSKAATTEWTDAEPERKSVWKDSDGEFKDIVTRPKYQLTYNKDNKEIKETYSRYPENLTIQTITKMAQEVK